MKKTRKFVSIFAILFALVFALSVCFFAACGNKDDDEKDNDTTTEQDGNTDTKDDDDDEKKDDEKKDEATVKEVSVSPSTLDLVVGGDVGSLEATVTMSETGAAFDGTCAWTVSPSGFVTVTADTTDSTKATVTAVAAGGATITVTAGGQSATCAVTVTEPYVDPYTEVTTLEELKSYTESTDEGTQYVRLGNDIVGTITVSADVVLDLNGKTLQNVADEATEYGTVKDTVTVTGEGSLTILDGTCAEGETVAEGFIKNIYSTTLNGDATSGYSSDSAAVIFTEGTVTIESGVLDGASVGIRAQAGTVEMNGGKISSDFYAVWEDVGVVTVTVNDGAIEGTRKGIYVGGDGNFGFEDYQTDAETTLIVNGGSVTCEDDSAICTLGYTSVDSAYIEINGGELTSNYLDDTTAGSGASATRIPAIYLPGGTLKVTDGAISGATALEVRGGKATIEGGTFETSASATNTPTYQGSGATSYGYSIAVYPFGGANSRHITDSSFDVSTTVIISDGTFDGGIYGTSDTTYTKSGTSYALDYTLTIIGGTFSDDPSDYLAYGLEAIQATADSTWEVAPAAGYYIFDNMGITSVIPDGEDDHGKTTSGTTFYFTESSCSTTAIDGCVLTYTSDTDKTNSTAIEMNGITYKTALQMDGSTKSSGNRSFRIDLSSYTETYTTAEISVVTTCKLKQNDDGSYTNGSLMISSTNTNTTTSSALAYVEAVDAGNEYQAFELTYSATLASTSELYITCANTARVYAIVITLA